MMLLAEHLQSFHPLFPQSEQFIGILPHLSLLAEALILILLVFKRTRVIGILFGFTFHSFLSIREFPPATDFPTLLGAGYILFFANNSYTLLYEKFKRVIDQQWFYKLYAVVMPLSIAGITILIIFIPIFHPTLSDNALFNSIKGIHWVIYVIIYWAIGLFILYKSKISKSEHITIFRQSRWFLLWIPLLLVFIGFSPYLGLKTHSALAMYSNLETEGNYTNHFFVPLETQIFDYQKQVCVIDTSASKIPLSAHTGELLTYYEFRKLTQKYPDDSIRYTFDGELFELEHIKDKPELVAEFTPFEKFYLIFQDTNWDNKTTYCNYRW